MLIEVVLDLFVRNVYAQLLKGVAIKVLKAKYVEDSNSQAFSAGRNRENKDVGEKSVFSVDFTYRRSDLMFVSVV